MIDAQLRRAGRDAPLPLERYIETLRIENAQLARAGRRDLTATVPHCPGWTVADAVRHIGSGQWWVEGVLRTGLLNGFDMPMPPGPGDEELVDWLEAGAGRLLATMSEVDPDLATCAMWTEDGTGTASFWMRRMPHHVAEHRWDAESAFGSASQIASDIAADGLDQILVSWLPWAARVGRQAQGEWAGETVQLTRDDGPDRWLVTLIGTGNVSVERRAGRADLAVSGPASELYLLAINRITVDSSALDVTGDRSIFARWAADIRWGTAANRSQGAPPIPGQRWRG